MITIATDVLKYVHEKDDFAKVVVQNPVRRVITHLEFCRGDHRNGDLQALTIAVLESSIQEQLPTVLQSPEKSRSGSIGKRPEEGTRPFQRETGTEERSPKKGS